MARRACRLTSWLVPFSAAVLVLVASPSFAQANRASNVLAVSATVVRSCTVQSPATESLPGDPTAPRPTGGPVTVRCGNRTVTYPAVPAAVTTASASKDAAPTVSASPNGKTVTIHF